MEFCAANGHLLPGFRFHPTDEELVMYYLKRKVLGKRLEAGVIAELDIYLYHPKDLPERACWKKDLNWYFFCPRWKKYGSGDRTNRATHTGYWKATGNDRVVSYQKRTVGKIKTLVFHNGKPPRGERTDWVMHEYRLEDKNLADKGVFQDSYVLCKLFKKSGWGPKNGEQYGAPFIEEEWDDDDDIPNCIKVVPVGVDNQSTSVVTNSAATSILVTVNTFPTSTSEQICSGAVSDSAVNQAPSSMLNAAANIASSSKGLIPDYNDPMDKELPFMSLGTDWASTSKVPPNYTDSVVQASSPMPKAADMASTSMGPVPPNYDDDERNSIVDVFTAEDIYGSLEDLGNKTVQGSESTWENFYGGNFYGGGLGLTDLDKPLSPCPRRANSMMFEI